VEATRNALDAECEFLEVSTLRCPQRVLPEERDHNPQQVRSLTDLVAEQMLAMVVVAPILIDGTYAEECPQVLQASRASRALSHCKLVKQLITGCAVAPAWSI